MSAKTPLGKTSTKKSATKKKSAAKRKPPSKADPKAAFREYVKGDRAFEMLNLSEEDLISNVPGYISTGSLALDKVIGHPGIPMARYIEISGDEHTGKSTVADHLIAQVQARGGTAILIDPEAGRDAKYTRSIGVDVEDIICPQPTGSGLWTVETVFDWIGDKAQWLIDNSSGLGVMVVVDSIAGLPTRGDLEREAGELKPGDAAKVIHHGMRTTVQRVAKSGMTVVLVNQLYENIGAFGFGDRKKEYGGKGIRYAASLRLRLAKVGTIKNPREEVIGSVSEARVLKAKTSGVTGSKARFAIIHGHGIDNSWTLFEALKEEGYITNKGAWWEIPLVDGEKLRWTGRHLGLGEKLRESPQLYEHLAQTYKGCVAA